MRKRTDLPPSYDVYSRAAGQKEGNTMEYLHYLAGPLIGAVIGYFTNYIAVKMLFHPHEEKRLFGKRLPFTPGVIPKNKPRLAHAIGEAVANVLLTKQDIAGLITDSATQTAGAALVAGSGLFGEGSLEDFARRMGVEDPDTGHMERFLTDKVWESVKSMDVGALVEQKAQEIIQSKPMLALLPVDSILKSITAKVNEYVESDECREKIAGAIHEKVEEVKKAPTAETLASLGLTQTAAEGYVASILQAVANSCVEPLLAYLNISQMIEDKINAMEIRMFEDLVMSVMKNELNAIVNLGFFIGLVIGVVNIFI